MAAERIKLGKNQPEEIERLRDAPKWRCFHCDFATSDLKEAEAHFGERDDAEEFKPLCKWWQRMNDGERAETLQQMVQELNAEREASEQAESRLRDLMEKVSEIARALNLPVETIDIASCNHIAHVARQARENAEEYFRLHLAALDTAEKKPLGGQ